MATLWTETPMSTGLAGYAARSTSSLPSPFWSVSTMVSGPTMERTPSAAAAVAKPLTWNSTRSAVTPRVEASVVAPTR